MSLHTQCANRPFCVTVMTILSAKLTVFAVVVRPLIVTVSVFVRAGYAEGVTTECCRHDVLNQFKLSGLDFKRSRVRVRTWESWRLRPGRRGSDAESWR